MAVIRSISGARLADTLEVLIMSINIVPHRPYYRFRLVDTHAFYKCEVRGRVKCLVLDLVDDNSPDETTFLSYFCSFNPDGVVSTRIGPECNYFFTAPLDGCSVGFGAANEAGNRTIAHANYVSAGNALVDKKLTLAEERQVQWDHQQNLIESHIDDLDSVAHPPDYGHAAEDERNLKTTLIGVKSPHTHQWEFIRQTYDIHRFD